MASAEPSAAPAGCRVDLSGQVALVTGASRGIGRAIAERLAACGATVAGVARTLEGLEGTLAAIREAGGTAEAFAANVADSADVKRIVEEVEAKFQKIHVLVNNAGITRDGLLLRMEDDAWQEVIDTNLKGTFLFCRAVGRLMMRQRYGRIINISSVSGLMGNPGQANYSASKAGVIGFTKTMARELASRGITVNVVAPGFITTDMTDVLPEKVKAEVKERVPVRRLGDARRHRRPGLLPGRPRRRLPDRPGHRRRRRHDGLSRRVEVAGGRCRGSGEFRGAVGLASVWTFLPGLANFESTSGGVPAPRR